MKKTYYVCIALNNSEILFKEVEGLTKDDAVYEFKKIYNIAPYDILGPFFKKRENSNRKLKNIKFSNIYYKAKYNGWNVSVTETYEPPNYCMVFYDTPIDSNSKKKLDSEIIPIWKLER